MVGDAGDVEIDFQQAEYAVAKGMGGHRVRASPSLPFGTMSVVRPNTASVVVLGEHGRGADVHAAVEEIVRSAAEAGSPGGGDGKVADSRCRAKPSDHALDDLTDGFQAMRIVVDTVVWSVT